MDKSAARREAMAEAFKSIAQSLAKESERGAVVLASAWLDEGLTRLISKYLRPVSKNGERLMGPGQPLGDFGTKIMLADRLGLINKNMVESLTMCRKLRNDFAHLSTNLSFASPDVKDRVAHLFRLNEDMLSVMGQTLKDAGVDIGPNDGTPINGEHMRQRFGDQELFHYTCGFISSGLAGYEHGLIPAEPQFDGS